jgi:hypothetical protein
MYETEEKSEKDERRIGFIYAMFTLAMPWLLKIGETGDLADRLRESNKINTFGAPTQFCYFLVAKFNLTVKERKKQESLIHKALNYCHVYEGKSTEFFGFIGKDASIEAMEKLRTSVRAIFELAGGEIIDMEEEERKQRSCESSASRDVIAYVKKQKKSLSIKKSIEHQILKPKKRNNKIKEELSKIKDLIPDIQMLGDIIMNE